MIPDWITVFLALFMRLCLWKIKIMNWNAVEGYLLWAWYIGHVLCFKISLRTNDQLLKISLVCKMAKKRWWHNCILSYCTLKYVFKHYKILLFFSRKSIEKEASQTSWALSTRLTAFWVLNIFDVWFELIQAFKAPFLLKRNKYILHKITCLWQWKENLEWGWSRMTRFLL